MSIGPKLWLVLVSSFLLSSSVAWLLSRTGWRATFSAPNRPFWLPPEVSYNSIEARHPSAGNSCEEPVEHFKLRSTSSWTVIERRSRAAVGLLDRAPRPGAPSVTVSSGGRSRRTTSPSRKNAYNGPHTAVSVFLKYKAAFRPRENAFLHLDQAICACCEDRI